MGFTTRTFSHVLTSVNRVTLWETCVESLHIFSTGATRLSLFLFDQVPWQEVSVKYLLLQCGSFLIAIIAVRNTSNKNKGIFNNLFLFRVKRKTTTTKRLNSLNTHLNRKIKSFGLVSETTGINMNSA